MLSILVQKFVSPSENIQYSFFIEDFVSPFFQTQEECLVFLLKYCLSKKIISIHLKGLNPLLCKKIDEAFGQSFKLKFKFANTSLEDFIEFSLINSLKKNDFFLTLTVLLAPFHKVNYDSPHSITLKLPQQNNPEITQFFESKTVFTSPDFSYIYRPGDITFFSDASCDKVTTLAGAAIKNKHLFCAFRQFISYEDNNLAELKAILETLFLAKEIGVGVLVLYTDNSNAIAFLCGKVKITQKNAHYFQVIDSIKEALQYFSSYSISWVPRKKNFIADNLSKHDFNGLFFQR
jgi:ribonuclease HI